MYCHICGVELPSEIKNCPDCGAAVPELRENRLERKPKKAESPKTTEKTQPIPALTKRVDAPRAPSPSDYQMKWYYFMIYAFLIISAVSLFISGLVYLFTDYIGLGFITIGLGIFALITRSALANYKSSAIGQLITYLVIMYITGIVGNLMHYNNLSYWDAEGFLGSIYIGSIVGSVIGGFIMTIGNAVYFSNRKELFVN